MKDSLDYTMYMNVARFITTRLEPRIVGCEPSYYPADMQLPPHEQKLLWNEFYASKEVSDGD